MISDLPAVLMMAKVQQKQIKRIEKNPCHWITWTDSSIGNSRFHVVVDIVIMDVLSQLLQSYLLLITQGPKYRVF